MIEKHLWVICTSYSIEQINERGEKKRGRPGKDEILIVKYVIDGKIAPNTAYIEREQTILGRFIVAPNDLDLDPENSRMYYLGQYQVEKGFRFLKDKIYREYKLRKSLKEANDTIPSQTGKPPAKTNDAMGVLYVSEGEGVVAAD